MFKILDLNGDGVISKEEIIEGKKLNLGYKNNSDFVFTEEEIERILVEAYRNNNGYLEYTGTIQI